MDHGVYTVSQKTRQNCFLSGNKDRCGLNVNVTIRFGAGADPGFAKGGHGERAEREPITGVWGRSPQLGPGGSGGEAPLKLKAFLAIFIRKRDQMLSI